MHTQRRNIPEAPAGRSRFERTHRHNGCIAATYEARPMRPADPQGGGQRRL